MREYSVVAQKPIDTPRSDLSLYTLLILFLAFGLLTLYISSASYAERFFDDQLYFVKRQLVSAAIGLVCMGIISVLNVHVLRTILPFIVIGSLVLCLLTFVPGIGIERNGSARWIKIPFLSTFQPSEAAKFAIVLFLANLFAKKHDRMDDPMVSVYPAGFGLFLFVFIIVLQGDFSTAVFLLYIGLVLFFIAGVKAYWFLLLPFLVFPTGILFIFTEEYRVKRLLAFLKPEDYANDINYQIIAARRAINAGQFWGEGIGSVRHIRAIPEIQADFIFAGWVEAMGFFGVIIYMGLLGFFSWKVFHIALTCQNRFLSLIAFGSGLIITSQSLLNIAVVCGALPTTGIPLPFFSSGGSSLLVVLCLWGLLINVSRYKNEVKEEFSE